MLPNTYSEYPRLVTRGTSWDKDMVNWKSVSGSGETNLKQRLYSVTNTPTNNWRVIFWRETIRREQHNFSASFPKPTSWKTKRTRTSMRLPRGHSIPQLYREPCWSPESPASPSTSLPRRKCSLRRPQHWSAVCAVDTADGDSFHNNVIWMTEWSWA